MKPRILAVVPARAGSKRLPKKNTKILNGKPLVSYTFEAIKRSKFISATVATSDCSDVLAISQRFCNTMAVKRPAALSLDSSASIDAVLHAITIAEASMGEFDIVCLLQPTSPLRTAEDIDSAIALYLERGAKGVVSMAKCNHSPLWTTPLDDEKDFKLFIQSLKADRSQDLPPYYQLNGAIYLVDRNELLKNKKLLIENDSYPFIMSELNSIDIDTELDFIVANQIMLTSWNLG